MNEKRSRVQREAVTHDSDLRSPERERVSAEVAREAAEDRARAEKLNNAVLLRERDRLRAWLVRIAEKQDRCLAYDPKKCERCAAVAALRGEPAP